MAEMGKPAGLVKRKGSAVWYYRKRCPGHLKAGSAPDEIWLSLETASYVEALARVDDARDLAMQRFNAAANSQRIYRRASKPSWSNDPSWPPLSVGHCAPLARDYFVAMVRSLDDAAIISKDMDGEAWDNWRFELEMMIADLSAPETENGRDYVGPALERILNRAQLSSVPGSQPWALLHSYLRRATCEYRKIELAGLGGDFSDAVSDSLLSDCLRSELYSPTSLVTANAERRTPQGVIECTVGEAADRYLEHLLANSTKEKTKDRYRAELKHITGYFGAELPVWQINAQACDGFRDCFSKLPPNFSDGIGQGRSLHEIAAGRNAAREIPIHPVLKSIGFVDWVQRRRDRGEVDLFPEVPAYLSHPMTGQNLRPNIETNT